MSEFGFITYWLSLLLLTGCMSDLAVQKQKDSAIRQTNQKLLKSLETIRQSEQALPLSNDMFRRQLALSFQKPEQSVTEQHTKIIRLFFQTLPSDSSLNIIISVAPTSNPEVFKSLQKAWERLQSLKQYVSEYSSQIELVYQPELDPDTALLQVVGG
ncbi:hypothetical protein ACH42_12705 [Endozoicomonas sp. (ex Bugula neritina AB1)]|nr:hypothetical protein ACH42_12705 [Endozoicomonas sp. (ex Bugula neritina AB1)]